MRYGSFFMLVYGGVGVLSCAWSLPSLFSKTVRRQCVEPLHLRKNSFVKFVPCLAYRTLGAWGEALHQRAARHVGGMGRSPAPTCRADPSRGSAFSRWDPCGMVCHWSKTPSNYQGVIPSIQNGISARWL